MCCVTFKEEISDQYVQLVENIDGEIVMIIEGEIVNMSDVVEFWEDYLQDNFSAENTDGNESEEVNEGKNEEDIFDMDTVILDDDLSYQKL